MSMTRDSPARHQRLEYICSIKSSAKPNFENGKIYFFLFKI